MRAIRDRISYANVVSTLALFLVVAGGSAFAATQLAKNSVGAKQLRKGAVTKAKIRKNAIVSSKVRNGSLRAADFASGQLPAGTPGATGPRGPRGQSGERGIKGETGAAGISGYVQVDSFTAFDSNPVKFGTATCPQGTTIIGGGATINGDNDTIVLRSSIPNSGNVDGADAWLTSAYEGDATDGNWNINTRAVCAKVLP